MKSVIVPRVLEARSPRHKPVIGEALRGAVANEGLLMGGPFATAAKRRVTLLHHQLLSTRILFGELHKPIGRKTLAVNSFGIHGRRHRSEQVCVAALRSVRVRRTRH